MEQKSPFKVVRRETWNLVLKNLPQIHVFARWAHPSVKSFPGLYEYVTSNLPKSSAQLQQDLLAQYLILENKTKRDCHEHYFVEIGALDGITYSNTYVLEKEFEWTGLLVEANQNLLDQLRANRTSLIDHRAVDEYSDQDKYLYLAKEAEFSSLIGTSVHEDKQVSGSQVKVRTVSLTDLLIQYSAPAYIDFLSIDTEGNEYSILSGLDFGKFDFGFICVEVTQNSIEINRMLKKEGYIQFLPEVSAWDQWWINKNLAHLLVK